MTDFNQAWTSLARGIDWASVNNAPIAQQQAVTIGTALDAVSVVLQAGGDVERAIDDAKAHLTSEE